MRFRWLLVLWLPHLFWLSLYSWFCLYSLGNLQISCNGIAHLYHLPPCILRYLLTYPLFSSSSAPSSLHSSVILFLILLSLVHSSLSKKILDLVFFFFLPHYVCLSVVSWIYLQFFFFFFHLCLFFCLLRIKTGSSCDNNLRSLATSNTVLHE